MLQCVVPSADDRRKYHRVGMNFEPPLWILHQDGEAIALSLSQFLPVTISHEEGVKHEATEHNTALHH